MAISSKRKILKMKFTCLVAAALTFLTVDAVMLQTDIEETAMTYEDLMEELEGDEMMDEERWSLKAAKKKAQKARKWAKKKAARAKKLAKKVKKAAESGDINAVKAAGKEALDEAKADYAEASKAVKTEANSADTKDLMN